MLFYHLCSADNISQDSYKRILIQRKMLRFIFGKKKTLISLTFICLFKLLLFFLQNTNKKQLLLLFSCYFNNF